MTNVIDVKFRERPKFKAPEQCLACKQKWEAESDDYLWLPTDTQIWVCDCKCDQFRITDLGMFCVGCGGIFTHTEIADGWSPP